jgi:hypothetical protein
VARAPARPAGRRRLAAAAFFAFGARPFGFGFATGLAALRRLLAAAFFATGLLRAAARFGFALAAAAFFAAARLGFALGAFFGAAGFALGRRAGRCARRRAGSGAASIPDAGPEVSSAAVSLSAARLPVK